MIPHTLTCVLFCALLFGSGCSSSYDPAAQPFKASFPGPPKKMKKTISPHGMTLQIDYTGYEFENGVFSVMFCDYPTGHVKNNGADNVLAGAANGAATNVGGTITSQKAISLGKHPGQEITIADPAKGMEIRNRIYLVGDRMYQVMVVTKGASTDSSKADQFLDSFEVK